MVNYIDFNLSDKQINNLKCQNAKLGIINYINEHGVEPENIDDYYFISDEDVEKYRQIFYSKYYIRIRRLNDIIKKDYNELYAQSSDLIYWESHITLNDNIENVDNVFELFPVSIENIFEINEVVIHRTTDLRIGKMTEVRVHDTWWESHRIYPDESILEIGDALKIYLESDVTRTNGNKVTIRRPLDPVHNHPCFIIGQQDSRTFIFIDAVTGEIETQYKN